jgi:hypothetical protein
VKTIIPALIFFEILEKDWRKFVFRNEIEQVVDEEWRLT